MRNYDTDPLATFDRLDTSEIRVQKRIEELQNPNVQLFNKLELIGDSYTDFFAPDQTIFPGHNLVGFQLDDLAPYGDVLQNNKLNDIFSKINAVDFVEINYFKNNNELKNAFKKAGLSGVMAASQKASDKRHELFYNEANEGQISISEIRNGAACTEMTAMAHNLLSLIDVPNVYCVDSFRRTGEDIDSTSDAHNSKKHSFIVLNDPLANSLYLYDPNDYSFVGKDTKNVKRIPLLFPINKDNSYLTGRQLTFETTISQLDHNYKLEYKINNFPKVTLQLGRLDAIGNI